MRDMDEDGVRDGVRDGAWGMGDADCGIEVILRISGQNSACHPLYPIVPVRCCSCAGHS